MQSEKFLSLFAFVIISLSISNYSYSIEPDVFVQSTVNRASKALDNKFSKEEKIKKLMEIANQTVDVNGIGLYTLGSYRKTITDDQVKQYKVLFRQYFLKSFSSRLAEYSNPEIEVISKKKLNENYTMVSSILVSTEKRPEVRIDWRIYTKNPEKPLIRDLIIEGLSLARTQKEEFSSIIQSNDGDINVLFNTLRNFIK
ncbi:ABC transporter substrate-binding protein [Candidatus Pelagibacter sp.]|jgi:phospholipid transport system substrate-binding protein|nr:ABC transporter substrate-binding protein [Candidatus Pelagibacter sp.]